jgi:hypothetical protein
MEKPLNVQIIKILSTLSYLSIGILSTISSPHILAAEVNDPPPPNTSAHIPEKLTSKKDSYSVNIENYNFTWSNNFDNNGNQMITPLTISYSKDNFDLGVRTAFVNSDGKKQVSVSAMSDMALNLAYNLNQSDFPIRFNLDLNLPTGKAKLSGDRKNAIEDEALLQNIRSGEGLNIAPEVSVTHAFSPNDVIEVGASYISCGKFNPKGTVGGQTISPGDEAVAKLQYQHHNRDFLAMGGLTYTNYGMTKRGDFDRYYSGNKLDANLTSSFTPFDGHRVQLSGRYSIQSPNTVMNPLSGNLVKDAANINGNTLYISLDWSISTDKQQKGRVHALVDYVNVQAHSYDLINNLYNAGRDKFSVGVGYDYNFSATTSTSVQLKYFQLIDKATVTTPQDIRSNGLNLYATVNLVF